MKCKKCHRDMERVKIRDNEYKYVCKCGYTVGDQSHAKEVEENKKE